MRWTTARSGELRKDGSYGRIEQIDPDGSGANDVLVSIISLSDVLSRLPPDVRVPMLKVDAEGFDVDVIGSAGEALRRVDRFIVELVGDITDGDGNPFRSREAADEVAEQLGFQRERCYESGGFVHWGLVYNCIYARNEVWIDADCKFSEMAVLNHIGEGADPDNIHQSDVVPPLKGSSAEETMRWWQRGSQLEKRCCHGESENPAVLFGSGDDERVFVCFNQFYPREMCCLSPYFIQIGFTLECCSWS